jgi:CRP/FNR family transcriptional regulator
VATWAPAQIEAPQSALLARLPLEVRRRVTSEAVPIAVPAGTVLFQPGDACSLYLLLLSGTVRVQLITPGGHQLLLYRVEPGQSCVLTTSCLIAHETYAAEGVAETALTGLGLSPALFERLLADSAAFRQLVFTDFGHRLADLMLLLNEVAFRRFAARLADWLIEEAGRSGSLIARTHHALAADLGTAREVVSRQLKEFERRGLLALARGRIEIRQLDALRSIAALADRAGPMVT